MLAHDRRGPGLSSQPNPAWPKAAASADNPRVLVEHRVPAIVTKTRQNGASRANAGQLV